MVCNNCQNPIDSDTRFCPNCGMEINKSQFPVWENNENWSEPLPTYERKQRRISNLVIVMILLVISFVGTSYVIWKNWSLNQRWDSLFDEMNGIDLLHYSEKKEELLDIWQSKGALLFLNGEEVLNELQILVNSAKSEKTKLENLSDSYQALVKEKDNFDLLDHKEEYEELLRSLAKALEIKDFNKSNTLEKEARKKKEDLEIELKEYINASMKSFEKVDFTYADEEDKKSYQKLFDELTKSVQEEKYQDIKELIVDLEEVSSPYLISDKKLDIAVSQVDASEYPTVRLYLKVKSQEEDIVPSNLDKTLFFIRKKDANAKYIKQKVSDVSQLNKGLGLNINVVMDVSASMEGYPLQEAKKVMTKFIQSVQFQAGDKVELTSFSTGVRILESFSDDANELIQKINSLYTDDMTSLYDALYAAVTRVASQKGAKCVIAFTDGDDNYSNATVQDVIDLAKRYRVPIFIIGVGDTNYGSVHQIATQSGGQYYNVYDFAEMEDIYQKIYEEEKELYSLEFIDSNNSGIMEKSDILVGYHSPEYDGKEEFTYRPNVLLRAKSSSLFTDGPEAVVEKYMKGFADAMTYSDFSYIEPYLLSGSKISDTQQGYVKKNIAESLDSYEIVDVTYLKKGQCHITTRETYYVQAEGEPLKLLTQQCKYNLIIHNNQWFLTDFVDSVKVLSNLHR